MEQAAVTSLFTLLGGIILFILSQYFLKFHFEPMSDLRKIIGQISKELVLYANLYSNPIDDTKTNVPQHYKDASAQLRSTASELVGAVQVIPWYRFWTFLKFIPPLKSIDEARGCIISISNCMWGPNRTHYATRNIEDSKTIIKELRIKAYK